MPRREDNESTSGHLAYIYFSINRQISIEIFALLIERKYNNERLAGEITIVLLDMDG